MPNEKEQIPDEIQDLIKNISKPEEFDDRARKEFESDRPFASLWLEEREESLIKYAPILNAFLLIIILVIIIWKR